MSNNQTPKSFWKRPEGVTGTMFLIAILAGAAYFLQPLIIGAIAGLLSAIQLGILIAVGAALVYMVLDPKMRNVVWYGYKSIMRKITGVFVQIDPIGILKNYVEDMRQNLRKMSKQIGVLKGEMRKLQGMIEKNKREIVRNMTLANKAKERNESKTMILKVRSAGRMKESNLKLEDLFRKMEVMYKVLTKMYTNAEILLEDTADQVKIKEVERRAIRTSHSAMNSAMNIMRGDKDKRQMFDMAMEVITEDVSQKVGEMERFMDISSNFMDGVDLQNGVFEEEGMKMLEKWEKETDSFLLGEEKLHLISENIDSETLDLNQAKPQYQERKKDNNQYDNLFD